MALAETFTSIANAIRAKSGETATMTPAEMPAKIAALPTGGQLEDFLEGKGTKLQTDAKFIVNGTMRYNQHLKAIYLPECLLIDDYSFERTDKVEWIYAPKASFAGSITIDGTAYNPTGDKAFQNSNFLKYCLFPGNTGPITKHMFSYSYETEVVDLGSPNRLENTIFSDLTSSSGDRYSLKALILRNSTVPNLIRSISSLIERFTSGECFIYVEDDLISEYQAATNWSAIPTSAWKGLSELPQWILDLYDPNYQPA
jgi:hypothetical protein